MQEVRMSNKIQCSCVLCKNIIHTNQLKIHYDSKQCRSGYLFSQRQTKVAKSLKCEFCDFVGKNLNSIAQHILYCKLNPNKKKKVPSYGMLGKKGKGSNQYIKGTNKPLSEETREKLRNKNKKRVWTDEERTLHSIRMKAAVKKYPESYNSSNRGRVKQIIYKDIKFHGTWEVEFYKWCETNNINCVRNSKGFRYEWNGERTYYPDFYLVDHDMYVEVKGYKTERDIAKWAQFPNKLITIFEKDIISIAKNTYKLPID